MTGTADTAPAIFAAVSWIEGTLLGTTATVVATIAVAAVGFMMFTGRIDWRLGARTILGCFLLFGASTIAAGLLTVAQHSRGDYAATSVDMPIGPSPTVTAPVAAAPSKSDPFDPYAGAAVPPW